MRGIMVMCMLGVVVLAGLGASTQQAVTRAEFEDVMKRMRAVESKAAMLDVRVKALEKSAPEGTQATPPTPTADPKAMTKNGVTLSGFRTRLLETNGVYHRYAWLVQLANGNPTAKRVTVYVTAYDKDGFEIDQTIGQAEVPARATVALSDQFLIRYNLVARVVVMKPSLASVR